MWGAVLAEHGLNEITARDQRYDAVLHMVTAADGAREFYTLANNAARTESPEMACELDRRTMNAWIGHPHLRVIQNRRDFGAKMDDVVREVSIVLGEPLPIEKERKFVVVEAPGDWTRPKSETFSIVQHYLPSSPEVERETRIRRRGRLGNWLFTMTSKEPSPDGDGRIERERLMSDAEYFDVLGQHPDAPRIEKERTVFVDRGRYFELDRFIYPPSTEMVLEVETADKGPIELPSFLDEVREVTHDRRFSNRYMAALQFDLKQPPRSAQPTESVGVR